MRPRMTCIIGGKCKDGVVLVADKKVTDPSTNTYEYMEKLFIFQKDDFYYPIVVGSSGAVPLFKKFKRAAIEELQKSNPTPMSFTSESFISNSFSVSGIIYPYPSSSTPSREILLYPYLDKLEKIIREYKKIWASEEFDVLFAAQVKYRGAILSHISKDGLSEDIDKHKTIGISEQITNVFLNILDPNKMRMKEFAIWCHFIIKHIEDYRIDDKVGVGKELPQIYFIPNEGQLYRAQQDFLDECEESRTRMAQNLQNLMSS